MNSSKFSNAELKRRKCKVMASLLFDVYEEGLGLHTRVSEMIIWDAWVNIGTSLKGGSYREHVVPLAYLTKKSKEMFEANLTLKHVEDLWFDLYLVATITKDEAIALDKMYKISMPQGWKVGDDPRERLWKAGIILDTDNKTRVAG